MTYNKERNIAYIKAYIPKDRLEQFKEEVRADERAKTIAEVYERYNGDLGSFGFWLYEQLKEQKRRIK